MAAVSQLFHNSEVLKMKFSFSRRVFLRKDYIRKDGTAAVNLRVIIDRKKIDIPLSLCVRPDQFDEPAGQVINHPYASDYNMIITKELSKANDIFIEHRVNYRELTLENFVKEFFNYERRHSFIDFYLQELKNRRSEVSEATYNQQYYTYEKLKDFRPNARFMDIDLKFLRDFDAFMKTRKNGSTTRHKNFEYVKYYVNLAVKRGIIKNKPFEEFKMPESMRRIVFLSQDELKEWIKFYDDPETDPVLKRASKYFLAICFTSLRISDILALDKERNIIDGNLVIIPKKNKKKRAGVPLTIKLSKLAKRFINDFEDNPKDRLHDVNINKHLKTIATKLNIKKNISTHTGRHTFATIFLQREGRVEVLQKIMDHSDISDTMIYVHITSELQNKQMDAAFEDFYTV